MDKEKEMVTNKTWEEFYNSGLWWFINTILHMFGWAIVRYLDKTGEIKAVYPARVRFRGFDEKNNEEGYIKVTEYLKENIQELCEEVKE